MNSANRAQLISQVKQEFALKASEESRRQVSQSTAAPTPEAHYEQLLGDVIAAITAGKFDSFKSGREILDAVESNSRVWLG